MRQYELNPVPLSHFHSIRDRFEAPVGAGASGLAMYMDRSVTVGMSARSTSQATRQLQPPKPSLNDSVKDEYSLSLLCNGISGEHVFTNGYHEYEQGAAEIIVKNRLKKQIGAYDFILDVIENGYKIPFYSMPPSVYLPNERSAVTHSDFVVQAIGVLLNKGQTVS